MMKREPFACDRTGVTLLMQITQIMQTGFFSR